MDKKKEESQDKSLLELFEEFREARDKHGHLIYEFHDRASAFATEQYNKGLLTGFLVSVLGLAAFLLFNLSNLCLR